MKTSQKYIFKHLLLGLSCFASVNCSAESLWSSPTNNERGFFSDRIAARIGDILTITVSETTTMTNSLSTTTSKDASIVNKVTQFLFASSGLGKHNDELPATDLTGKNSYTGTGAINNSSGLTAKASVTVVDILPNRNLVIEGVRKVTFSRETEYAILRGIVRPYDINTDNTVPSDRIANAQIEFIKEGALSASQKKGWLLRFNDYVNPF